MRGEASCAESAPPFQPDRVVLSRDVDLRLGYRSDRVDRTRSMSGLTRLIVSLEEHAEDRSPVGETSFQLILFPRDA